MYSVWPNGTQAKEVSPSAANELSIARKCDILLYSGDIERRGASSLIDLVCERKRLPNVLLVLVTYGGDPDAAYKIARTLQFQYEKFTIVVPGLCKSAGTMVALGANEIVMSPHGELGPIDVQMSKKDELWEMELGLTVNDALQTLREKAHSAFDHFVIQTKSTEGAITSRRPPKLPQS